jgi:peptidoglycan/xylan/chitin deacetylase (PgdA/CDA1 family)
MAGPIVSLVTLQNFNVQFADQPVEKTDLLVTQGHVPLLKVYERHPQIKADLFFTGVSAEYLADHHPAVVEAVLAGRARGQFAIGTYTYAHPVLPLVPREDARRQVARGLEADQRVWGFRPSGLLLPEAAWDMTLPAILSELGLEWVVLDSDLFAEYRGQDAYPGTVFVPGTDGAQTIGILRNDRMRIPVDDLDYGKFSAERYLAHLQRYRQRLPGDQFLILATDAENLYLGSLDVYGLPFGAEAPHVVAAEYLDRLYSLLEAQPWIRFVTIEEYLAEYPPQLLAYAESKRCDMPFDLWLYGEGRERLNVLEAEARGHVRSAEYVVGLARAQGANVQAAERLLEQAWDQLLLAENSDGRGHVPHFSRKLAAGTSALNAARLAQQASQAIRF